MVFRDPSVAQNLDSYIDRVRRAAMLLQDGHALELLVRLGRKLAPKEPAPDAMLDAKIYEAWRKKHRPQSRPSAPLTLVTVGRGQSAAALNKLVKQSSGDALVFVEEGDTLAEEAFFVLAQALQRAPGAVIYADHDYRLGAHFLAPCLKPDFSPTRLLAQNYIAAPVVMPRELFVRVGRFRTPARGALLYDLVLRASENAPVVHVPEVLCHRTTDRAAWPLLGSELPTAAHRRAVASALRRRRIAGSIENGRLPGALRVRPRLRRGAKVSIIIPFRDRSGLLDACLSSLIEHTPRARYDVILVDNGSQEEATTASIMRWKRELSARVLSIPGPCNFAELNNRAARVARGDQLLLLNNDTEFIDDGWLDALLEWSLRPDVGAVGPMLLYPDKTIQHAGLLLGVGGAVGHAFLGEAANAPGYFGALQVEHEVSAVTGACLMVGREKFWRAGGLDQDRYRVIYNDVSLCLQLRQLGLRTLYTPHARLVHHESKSRGDEMHPAEDRAFFKHYRQQLLADPYYHPLLSRRATDFRLAK